MSLQEKQLLASTSESMLILSYWRRLLKVDANGKVLVSTLKSMLIVVPKYDMIISVHSRVDANTLAGTNSQAGKLLGLT
jgi:hypothetical protein